jgi:hypothetical protein
MNTNETPTIEGAQCHEAHCKFCHCSVTLQVHPDAVEMFKDMDAWKKMTACNRCADYHSARLTITRAIQAIANKLLASQKQDQIEQAKSRFTELTRKLASNASTHYDATLVWDQDWVEQIIGNPPKATSMCLFYERSLWKTWNQRRREQRAVTEVML